MFHSTHIYKIFKNVYTFLLMLGKTEGRRRRRATEDKIVGCHHQLDGHEFEQTLGDSEGQRSLVCCSSRGHKESDTT